MSLAQKRAAELQAQRLAAIETRVLGLTRRRLEASAVNIEAGASGGLPKLIDPVEQQRTLDAVERLPRVERGVVHLLYFEGKNTLEAAEALGLTEREVRTLRVASLGHLNELKGEAWRNRPYKELGNLKGEERLKKLAEIQIDEIRRMYEPETPDAKRGEDTP